jgi:hypothetical protein
MADFSGIDLRGGVRIAPFNVSGDLSTILFTAGTLGVTQRVRSFCGANTGPGVVHPVTGSIPGIYEELAGGQIFERILVNPRTANVGFVITDTQFAVEAWNTFRNIGKILSAIDVLGPGDIVVQNPFALPTFYGAQHSRVYQVLVSHTGGPQIDADIEFIWQSGEQGADTVVIGSRIVLFSAPIDWDYGVKEKIEYLTDVLPAYSDAEQRRALRQQPRRGLSFRAKGLTAREAAAVETQIFGWQQQPFGVLWWPDVSPLLADAAAGATAIQVNTTDFQFAANGIAALWKDEFTFEAVQVTAVGPTSLTLASPTQNAWKAGPTTLVMPVFLCRLPDDIDVTRLFSGADQIDLDFAGEAGQNAPAPAISLTQYKGFDVLELPAQWPDDLKRKYSRSLIHIDPQVGPITVIDKGGTPITSQPFPWLMLNHSQVTSLRAFFLARFGKLKPFWIPTWDQDLVLAQDVALSDTGMKIQSEFYSRFMFPANARHYVALIPMDGSANMYRKIATSTDNGDGTETLVFDAISTKAFPAKTTMVSFLIFARLDADSVEIDWLNNDLAQTVIEMRELPRELP